VDIIYVDVCDKCANIALIANERAIMNNYSQVRYWVQELPKRGQTTFSLEEAECTFSEKPKASVRRALARLSDSGAIRSVWRGFYAVSLPEYGLEGIPPPLDYIQQLMNHLGVEYYIALLTAASYNNASHHAPQIFQVICNSILRENSKCGHRIEPVYKKKIPQKYLKRINSRTASVAVSTPELTAVDLIAYMRRVGGISQAAAVLMELAESIDFQKVDSDFFNNVPASVIQRLGYLLDEKLEEKLLADCLFEKSQQAGMTFKTTLLVPDVPNEIDTIKHIQKWRISVNYEVGVDL
jgi:predicted transcriptional regulator of viral defense system